MLEQILKEKTSADHLLYVSLKYTKTCEVILNLIRRWSVMIEFSIEALLKQAKKKKKIKSVPAAPRKKVDLAKIAFKKNPEVTETIALYEFFRRIENLRLSREHEFRKDVCLRVFDAGNEIPINLEKLKEYSKTLERFISFVRQYLTS